MKFRDLPIIRIFFHWFDSANAATEGILHAVRTQPHIKFHLMVAFLVLFICFIIGIEKFEFIVIDRPIGL